MCAKKDMLEYDNAVCAALSYSYRSQSLLSCALLPPPGVN